MAGKVSLHTSSPFFRVPATRFGNSRVSPHRSSPALALPRDSESAHYLKLRDCQIRTPRASNDGPETAGPPGGEVDDVGVKVALSILKFYKREISPILPKSCRYVPTCSEYSMEAYKKYGFVKGTILTAWRLCRCNPLGGSGFDPPRWFDEEIPIDE